jgi:hypothetical protein
MEASSRRIAPGLKPATGDFLACGMGIPTPCENLCRIRRNYLLLSAQTTCFSFPLPASFSVYFLLCKCLGKKTLAENFRGFNLTFIIKELVHEGNVVHDHPGAYGRGLHPFIR